MGYLKLDRRITNSAIWDDGAEPFDSAHAWIDLLLFVNWDDGEQRIKGKIYKVKRGSKIVSDRFLSNRWHWSRNRVRRFLETLERAGMVTTKRTTCGTWLFIENYAKYQDSRTTNGTTHGTSNGTTHGATHGAKEKKNKEEVKNNKKEREGQAPHSPFRPSEEFVRQYCSGHNLKINVDRFMAYYGARDWTLGKGMKVERPDQLEQLIKSWSSTEIDEKPESKELVNTMPAYQEFAHTPVELGEEPKFEGGVVAELLRRKRMKNA